MIWHTATLFLGFMVGYFAAALLSANARMHTSGDEAVRASHFDLV